MSNQKLFAELYASGIRRVDVDFEGGEDSGGISGVKVFPPIYFPKDKFYDALCDIGGEAIESEGIGFNGDGHYSGAFGGLKIEILNAEGETESKFDCTTQWHCQECYDPSDYSEEELKEKEAEKMTLREDCKCEDGMLNEDASRGWDLNDN